MNKKWQLRNLINLTKYCYSIEKENYTKFYKLFIEKEYKKLSNDDIYALIEMIKKETDITSDPDTKKDIFLNNKQSIFKTILINLNKELKTRNIEKHLSYKDEIIFNLENKIRETFIYLLKKHINKSQNQSEEYIDTLTEIINNLELMYKETKSQTLITDPVMQVQYLESQIINIINQILTYDDELLQSEKVYSYVIALQTLLRSLFIELNNTEKINAYAEYIEKNISTNYQAKNIILTAIIANNHDKNEISKVRSYKDV